LFQFSNRTDQPLLTVARLTVQTMKTIKTIKRLSLLPLTLLILSCGGGSGSNSDNGDIRPALAAANLGPDPDSNEFRRSKRESHRFLEQATFGPTLADMSRVAHIGEEAWINEQLNQPATLMLPAMYAVGDARWNEYVNIWWKTAIVAPDQLRQRVAFALSEIFVISAADGLGKEQYGLANYYDILVRNAFGNYRDLIEEITLNPIMGEYLSMKGNHKPDPKKNLRPDENYARELLQLFSIGLVQLRPDGSVVMGTDGVPVPTYDQDVVEDFAHVFTGWHFANAEQFRWPKQKDFLNPMVPFEDFHDTGEKQLLNGQKLAAGNSAEVDLRAALDNIFQHPNVGPFLAKRLIQRLVTSNPSAQYIADISAVFEADESGVRGSLGSMVKAILLHEEALNGHIDNPTTFGKLKEPVLRVTALWRAFTPEVIKAEFNYSWARNDIGQAPLNSPSVFNFFTPDFSQPGEVRNSGLVSPEFQIHDESSIIKITNRMLANTIWAHNYKYESDAHRIALNIKPQVELVETDPELLLDQLDLLLLGGEMTDELRQRARDLMSKYTSDSASPNKVIEVIFLIASSPESAVQI